MKILPYKLSITDDLLTSRAGLVCLGEVMTGIKFSQCVDTHFPSPKSNRGFEASVFVNALVFMLHEGGNCLDDVRYIRDDKALRELMGLTEAPESDSIGDWLRRYGENNVGVNAVTDINRSTLSYGLGELKPVTLDIDATLSSSEHKAAKKTYKGCRGYMPIVGHIAETGQVVAVDFRQGNVAPATRNLDFIQQSEAGLPAGVKVAYLRSDAAGYQAKIIDYCINRDIDFAIRAKMNAGLKQVIEQQADSEWTPLIDRRGKIIEGESTCRIVHTMGKSEHAFTVVVQRKQRDGQLTLDLEEEATGETLTKGAYIYRAIATDRDALTDSEVIHWYNHRGEHSENRIKELKEDFGAGRMPCGDFDANALYFSLCTLAYNLFVLMRKYLPKSFQKQRAKTIRWRLYALAGKVVKHGRKVYLKLKKSHCELLTEIMSGFSELAQAFP